MKTKSVIAFFAIALVAIATSCKNTAVNPNLPVIQLTAQDNGKTTLVSQGQLVQLTLSNPGDGGYDFDAPQYQKAVLSLKSQVHTLPTSGNIGDFGTDTWNFEALRSGPGTITVTATRGTDAGSTTVMFSGTVNVK